MKSYTLEMIKKEANQENNSQLAKPFLGAGIAFEEVKNDKELDNFIKKRIGGNCTIDKKYQYDNKPMSNPSLASWIGNVTLKSQASSASEGEMDTSCGNSKLVVKDYNIYNSMPKAMIANFGQECQFTSGYSNPEELVCFEDLILSSVYPINSVEK